jgi:TPR repeat protein
MRSRLAILAAGVALGAAPIGAHAQFYDLDGAYHCVTAPDKACDDAGPGTPGHPAPPPAAKSKDEAPSFGDAVERVKRRAPTEADIRLLEQRADANDPRATEVLAWCKLNGIGTAADAMAAYRLYRAAAALGVANAKTNETAIYETRLTSAERQQVLKENAR